MNGLLSSSTQVWIVNHVCVNFGIMIGRLLKKYIVSKYVEQFQKKCEDSKAYLVSVWATVYVSGQNRPFYLLFPIRKFKVRSINFIPRFGVFPQICQVISID